MAFMALYLIILLFIVFPFGQLTRLPLNIPEVNIYLQDILVGGLAGSWIIYHLLKKIPFPKPPLLKPILFFFAIALLSLLVNSFHLLERETLVAGLYLVRFMSYAGIYFITYDLVKKGNINGNSLKLGLIFAGVASAIFGLVQYFLYPDLGNLAYLGWDPHKFRIFGTFFDPAFLGLILVLTIILIIDYLIKTGGLSKIVTRRLRYTLYLILSTCYLTLALTYSRSSYLALLAGMGIVSWLRKNPKIFLITFFIIVATIIILPRPPGSEGVRLEREETIWGRIKNWENSLVIFKDNPVFGVGFNAYRYSQKKYGFLEENDLQKSNSGAGADSSLLFVLATTGIFGFFAYLLIWLKAIRTRSVIILSSISALLIHSFFSNSLFYPWIMLWIWVLLGAEKET